MEIVRHKELQILKGRLDTNPIVAILGPRQCGKTTLANQFSGQNIYKEVHSFDCEDPRDLARLDNPLLSLELLKGLIIIDEIQRNPELFPILRVLVDKFPDKKFLVLGSASRDLVKQSSESLAGRISFLELSGFALHDISSGEYNELWIRGNFPRAFLAKNQEIAAQWREDFIQTFLERDIPNLGIQIPAITLRRFWAMLAHYHGQIFNAAEIGKSLNFSDKTVKRYLDILSGTYLIRQLQPWYYNTKKRLIKRPKIYFRDSGLFHSFLSIENKEQLLLHPKLGASWEGFALEQIIIHLNLQERDVFFWGVHTGAELDLLFQLKGKLWGVEFKYSDTPKITPSMKSALTELNLSHLWIVYPGTESYLLDHNITAVGLYNILNVPAFEILE
ncbi:MAG: AAA family ATPase [Calditrichae bacterium]|nr:AAA family ATPase [Calditrichia bacterium]